MRTVVATVSLLVLFASLARGQEESRFRPAGKVAFEPIAEMSGIAKSNTYADIYWVMNDSGDTARIFAVDGTGAIVKPPFWNEEEPYEGIELLVAANVDWEDITIDGDTLYVADVGNNNNARRDLGVYVLPEPNPRAVDQARPTAFLPIRYPEQEAYPGNLWHWDCEAVFVSEGKLYFITKHRVPGVFNSGEWGGRLYRLDTRYTDRVNVLTLVDSRPDLALSTAAAVSPNGDYLALLTAFSLHVYLRPREGDRWLSGKDLRIPLDRSITKQAEAVCWDSDRVIRIANEQREIYTIPLSTLEFPTEAPTISTLGPAKFPKTYELPGLRFSPNGNHLLVAHAIKEEERGWGWTRFALIDTSTVQTIREFEVETTGPAVPAFSPNGRFLAYGVPAGSEAIEITRVDLSVRERPDVTWKVPHRGGETLPTVQAVSDDGTVVALSAPWGPGRRESLLVWSLTEGKALARIDDYQEPSKGLTVPGAVLAGGKVFCHARKEGRAGGGGYRLIALDLASGRGLAKLPGWVTRHTPGHVVSRNARWILNGGADYEITRTRLDGRPDEVLFECHEQLYSHWLELTASANEWMFVAWSSERRVLCCYDTVEQRRFDLPLPEGVGTTLVGLSPHGRYAYLTGGPPESNAIHVLDLWRKKPVGKLLDIPNARAVMDPTGRLLATLIAEGEEWEVKMYRLR